MCVWFLVNVKLVQWGGGSKLSLLDFWVQKCQLTEIHVNVNRSINKNKFYIITYLQKIFWVKHVDQTHPLPPFPGTPLKHQTGILKRETAGQTGKDIAADVTSRKTGKLERKWMGGNWLSTRENCGYRESAGSCLERLGLGAPRIPLKSRI